MAEEEPSNSDPDALKPKSNAAKRESNADEPESKTVELEAKNAKKNPKKSVWRKLAISEEDSREAIIRNNMREFIIYSLFLTVATIAFVDSNTRNKYNLHNSLQKQFIETQFPSVFEEYELKSFEDIKTASDFWRYMEMSFMESVYNEYWYDRYNPIKQVSDADRNILYENKLIGVPRIRQLKVRNDSCIIPDSFKRQFFSCYASYSQTTEQKTPFGLKSGTAWTWNDKYQTESDIFTTEITTYMQTGYYAELSRNPNKSKEILSNLKSNLWIDRGTRIIFVDLTVYNANVNLFCFIRIIFEFPSTGGVIPNAHFFVESLLTYETSYDFLRFGLLWIIFIYIFYFIALEVINIMKLKWRYLQHMWNYIGVLIILLFFVFFYHYIAAERIIPKRISRMVRKHNKYTPMDDIKTYLTIQRNTSSVFLFFVWIKIFKYFSISQKLGQLNQTLRNAAWDLVGFTIMFLIVFFAFAMLGYLLFGTKVDDFRTFSQSMFTLLRTILGDFDYLEIERAERTLGPLFFICYIFFIFFVLLNIFLAILIQAYSIVKYEASSNKNDFEVYDFLKKGFKRLMKKCPCIYKKQTVGRDTKADENIIEKIIVALRKVLCNGFMELLLPLPDVSSKSTVDILSSCIKPALKMSNIDLDKTSESSRSNSTTPRHNNPNTFPCNFDEMEIKLFVEKNDLDRKKYLSARQLKDFLSDVDGPKLGYFRKSIDGRERRRSVSGGIDRAEYEMQISRLYDIEESTKTLANKVDSLLKKLDNLENMKARRP